MSTLKVGSLRHYDADSDALVLSSDGRITFNGTVAGFADSAQVQAQFDSAFPSAFDTRFATKDTHDSAAVQAQFDSAFPSAFDTRLAGDVALGNMTTTGYLRGPSTFTIDPAAHGDSTGLVTILGNLQVEGATTTINSTTLTVNDKNIVLADSAANAAAADGAGITVAGASATLTYNSTPDAWSFNKRVGVGYNDPSYQFVVSNSGAEGLEIDPVNQDQTVRIFAYDRTASDYITMGNFANNHYWTAGGSSIWMQLDSSGDLTLNGNLHAGRGNDVSMSANADGMIQIDGNAYTGAITMDATAMYLYHNSGSRNLVLATNETAQLTLDYNGNVELNRGSLIVHDANGSLDNALRLTYAGTSGQGDINVRSTGGSTYLRILTSNAGTSGEVARFTYDGNVGIGTTNPNEKLHINGGNVEITSGTSTTSVTNLILSNAYDTAYLKSAYVNPSSNTETYLAFHTNTLGDANGTVAEQMRIAGKNIGIGLTAPGARLDIQTPSYATSTTDGMIKFNDSVNGHHLNIQSYHVGGQGSDIVVGSNAYVNTSGGWTRWTASYGGAAIRYGREGALTFLTNSSAGVVTQKMSINSDGQVFIGQTTSTSSGTASKFQVTGNIDLNGSAGSTNVLRLYSSASEKGQLYAHNGGVTLYAHSGSETNLYSNGSLTMQISDGNKVQINATNTPTYTLEVAGTNDINFRIMPNFQQTGTIRIGRSDGTNRWHDIVAYNDTTQNANYIAFDVHNGTLSSTYRAARIQGDGTIKAGGGLQAQLQRAYTNVGVINNNRMPVGHYTPGETVFEIDPTWSSQQLQDYFNLTSAQCDWVQDSTAPGGYAIKITGNRSVGGVYASGFPYIPIDTDDKFYMECYIKTTGGGTLGHYMGSNEFSQTFASLGGNPGSFGYWVMSNTQIAAASGWVKVSGYITGFGNSVGQFETGTKYWTPMALFNYTLTSGTRESYISGWKVIRVGKIPGDRRYSGHQFTETSASIESGSGQTLYSSGTGIGLHGTNSYSSCGSHLEIGTDATKGWANVYLNRAWTSGEDNRWIEFRLNGASIGSITNSSTTSTAYNTTSDYRLKENIVPLENATERLKQIPVRRFNFISDPTTTVDGFVAHEVFDYVPEAITGQKDATRTEEYIITEGVEEVVDDQGNVVVEGVEEVRGTREVPVYQGIDQSKLVPLMLATIKELEARITQLEGQ